ncbi:MAG: hypothetical protein V4726_13305 [Verrucomicrobiota bacterium]
MNKHPFLIAAAVPLACCPELYAQTALPASVALPVAAASQPGFIVRTAQAPEGSLIDNTYLRAVRQMAGTLKDAEGTAVENIAVEGLETGGVTYLEKLDLTGDLASFTGYFQDADVLFPGLQEFGQSTLFASEAVTYLKLPAGTIRLGVSSGVARTDALDDDGWRLFVGENPRSFFAAQIAETSRNVGGFPSETQLNTGNQTEFTLTVPVAGVYPVRLLYWQQGGKSMLEWYLVRDPEGPAEERVLLNGDTAAAIAYRSAANAPRSTGPYAAEVSPLPESSGVPAADPVKAVIRDGTATVVDASVKLTLNGAVVTPVITRQGKNVLVSFNPSASRAIVQNVASLEFRDSGGQIYTNQWKFSITAAAAGGALVTGQWDFDQGDLRATTGAPLEYFSATAAAGTEFGTTRDFQIPDIADQPALVMRVPGDLNRAIGYVMRHGVSPNGGGTLVNQYTLTMDVLVEASGAGAASLLQTSSLTNTDDGDLFWQGNNFGQGGNGYNGTGQFTAGTWHRVTAAYDMAAIPPVVTKYVDGIKQDDWIANQGLDNPRRAMQSSAILFGDGDQDERRTMYLNSIQVRAGKLTDAQMVILGGPEACGLPKEIPTAGADVAGQWDFERGTLDATIGAPLQYLDGAEGTTKNGTVYGTPADLGVAELPGGTELAPSRVMKVPGELDRAIGYLMTHRIAPNGGGTLVNQYTLVMDIYVESSGAGAASLLQTSSLLNTDDGDLFWQGNNFGQGGNGYNGTGQFTAGAWHRVAIAYDMAAVPPVAVKYVDGIKQDDWTANQSLDNPRRAMQPTAVLFGDGDQDERRAMYLNSIQVRPGRLGDAELALLGGPQSSGIPVALPVSNVTGQWDFDRGDLAATVGSPLQYLDGAEGLTKTSTLFGSTTDLGVTEMGDVPARVMAVPGDLLKEIGYTMTHRIAPNGGGTLVNQYTLIMDVMVASSGAGAASMLQIDTPDNTTDGDLFWQGNNFGQGGNGYNGTGQFTAGAWHRVAASYNMAATPPVVVKVVDGVFQDNWTANQGLDNARRALKPTAVLFGDGDQDERRAWWVNSIQIRSAALTQTEMEALGGPETGGIPIQLPMTSPAEPRITFGRGTDGRVLYAWDLADREWILESSPDLKDWKAVTGITANFALITPAASPGHHFLRLRQKTE